jgi:hypothetical protein
VKSKKVELTEMESRHVVTKAVSESGLSKGDFGQRTEIFS